MLPSIPQKCVEDQIQYEGRLASDLQLVRGELAYARASEEQLRAQFSASQEELNRVRLELSTALAASQIRVEQLQNTVQDMRYDATEAKQERSQLRMQLDAARDAYLQMQRNAQESSEEVGKLRQEVVRLKSNAQSQVQQLKHAMHGAASILSTQADLGAALDALLDSEKAADQRSFLLAKIAVLSKEKEDYQQRLEASERENKALHGQLDRYSSRFQAAGAGAGTGVQLLYEELEMREEEIRRLRETLQVEVKAAATEKQRAAQAEQRVAKAQAQVSKYKKAMEEVSELRRIVRGMIQGDAEGSEADEQ